MDVLREVSTQPSWQFVPVAEHGTTVSKSPAAQSIILIKHHHKNIHKSFHRTPRNANMFVSLIFENIKMLY